MVLGALFLFSLQDIIIKFFADDYSVLQLVFIRALVALPALAIMGVMVMIYVTSSGIRGVTWMTVAQAIWMFIAIWAAAFWRILT